MRIELLSLRAFEFIQKYDLHSNESHRVDLMALIDHFPFSWAALPEGIPAMTRPRRSADDKPLIWLDKQLTRIERRIAYVHEIGHHVLDHVANYQLMKRHPARYDQLEREARQFAAMVLIKPETILAAPSLAWIEVAAQVPAWVISEYPGLMRARNQRPESRPALFR